MAYCLLGYLCAYFRYYHPLEFLTSFLNNAANDTDIVNGTTYAEKIGVKVTLPKWGYSRGEYFFNTKDGVISKGLSSIKYLGNKVANELYELSQKGQYHYFVDVLRGINKETSVDSRQIDILIKIDFFSAFGNQRELFRIFELFQNTFKCGDASRVKRENVDGTPLEPIVQKYAVGVTKSGGVAKSYTLLDVMAILHEAEALIKSIGLSDLDDMVKIQNFYDVMGYFGYVSGKQEDRRKLYITDIKTLCRKSDGKQFGYSIFTKSLGSGKESRFTVFNRVFDSDPISKGNIIYCKEWSRDGAYFRLESYSKVV